MKLPQWLAAVGVVVLSVAVAVMTSLLMNRSATAAPGGNEVYERVIKAAKIRCGYVVYPPSCIKDPNSGKISGIMVDTIRQVGKNLSLDIDFTEEVAWGSMIEGLQTDRYDLVVSGIWPNSSRAKLVDFSDPLYYSAIGVYVRQDDDRFKGNWRAINAAGVKIATIDGEMSDIIARTQFPDAARDSLPQTADVSRLLLEVATRKADVTFVEPYFGYEYLKSNPGSVKNIATERPIRIFGNTVMFRGGQPKFKAMLNTAIEESINTGSVDALLDQYEPEPGLFYRKAFPYRLPR
jgi:polar amino acid transport system substrate-binding protein